MKSSPMIQAVADKPRKTSFLEDVPTPVGGSSQTYGLHDRSLGERIHRALCETGQLQLRGISVTASEGTVVLKGRVSSYYLKQVAQTQVLAFDEVKSLANDLHVA